MKMKIIAGAAVASAVAAAAVARWKFREEETTHQAERREEPVEAQRAA